LFAGFLKKDILLKKKGAWLTVSLITLTAVFFIVMKSLTGYAGYAVPTARGFFPENLVHWFPIVPSSFMNLAFLTSQTNKVANISFDNTMKILEIINVVTIFSLVALFLILFFNKKFLATLTPFKWFFITGFFVSAATFVSLGYLSFTYAPQTWIGYVWSYVYDHRYYAFTVLFLQICFFGWLYLYKNLLKSIFLKIVAFIFGLFLFIEVTHNIYFHTKVAFNFRKYKSEAFREQDYVYFFKLIKELEKKYPDHDIWTASSGDDFYPYVGTYYGHTGIMDAVTLKNPIQVKKKTILALVLYDHELGSYNDLLSRSKIEFTHKVDNSNYYIIELLP
jgi:hypothetical protein